MNSSINAANSNCGPQVASRNERCSRTRGLEQAQNRQNDRICPRDSSHLRHHRSSSNSASGHGLGRNLHKRKDPLDFVDGGVKIVQDVYRRSWYCPGPRSLQPNQPCTYCKEHAGVVQVQFPGTHHFCKMATVPFWSDFDRPVCPFWKLGSIPSAITAWSS